MDKPIPMPMPMPMPTANRSVLPASVLTLVTLVAIVAFQGRFLMVTPAMTAVISGALLVFGLPHGAFDIALLRRAGGPAFSAGATIALVALYLLGATVTYLLWRAAPGVALAAFLAIAVLHFAEDWCACGSRFTALGIAAAIVSAPALLHREILGGLFVLLTGDARSATLADLQSRVAPPAIVVAMAGALLLYRARQQTMAAVVGCTIAALVFLPPVVGFALFFCLVHSPVQFRHHAESLGLHGFRQWGGEVIPLSIGGLGIATVVFASNSGMPVTTNLFAASFMTLAVLTVPHMLVPMIAGRWRQPPLLASA